MIGSELSVCLPGILTWPGAVAPTCYRAATLFVAWGGVLSAALTAGAMHGLWAAAAAPPALTSLTFRGHETGGLPPGAWPRLAGAAALVRLHLHALLEVPDALAAAVAGAACLEARVPRWGAPGGASWRPAGALAGA